MIEDDFYSITGPAEWADPPTVFSYSALHAIKTCPLQWQLLNSKYGHNLRRFPARPAPAAVEGNIVHSVLEKLFRALSLIGLPALGTSAFHECITRLNIKQEVASRISAHEEAVAQHPRGNGFRLWSSSQQLVNKIIRLFRQQYSDVQANSKHSVPIEAYEFEALENEHTTCSPGSLLKRFGALSEIKIKHPSMPFMGIVDLVYLEKNQPVLADFKTGKTNNDHLKQINTYALLWWRQTGEVPKRLEIRYPHGVESVLVDESFLKREEKQLYSEINDVVAELSAEPAKALHGEHCGFCDVRQFCESFWEKEPQKIQINDTKAQFVDIAVTVDGNPTQHGFSGKTNRGVEVAIVFAENTSKPHLNVQDGQKLRILSALTKGNEIIVKPRTEIYHYDHVVAG